ncbi:MAG: hypothetical protein H6Q74_2361 [Firmicutes bacterium]|nr:hypothetical protein [Bacillota bacterium]
MPVDGVSLGQVVRTNAGRDKGSIYLVVGIKVPNGVWVANGRNRSITKPKLKNVRHISVLALIDKGVAAKIASEVQVTDEEIRQSIKACVYTGE